VKIKEVLDQYNKGQMLIVVDDEDRE
ncbi:uncharacterized protein METZ01_LOCUS372871, partial [marine metagenome]